MTDMRRDMDQWFQQEKEKREQQDLDLDKFIDEKFEVMRARITQESNSRSQTYRA